MIHFCPECHRSVAVSSVHIIKKGMMSLSPSWRCWFDHLGKDFVCSVSWWSIFIRNMWRHTSRLHKYRVPRQTITHSFSTDWWIFTWINHCRTVENDNSIISPTLINWHATVRKSFSSFTFSFYFLSFIFLVFFLSVWTQVFLFYPLDYIS